MIYNKMTRRHFLHGMGASLALPLLPSLLPRQAWAQSSTPQVRYIQVLLTHSMYPQHFFPSDTGLTQMADGTFARPLSSISGDISTVLGPAFTPFKNDMTIFRGLHCLAASNLHNGCLATCASSTPEDKYGKGRPFFPFSIDTVLSESAKIYPDPTGKQRHVNFAPANAWDQYSNYSWVKTNGSVQQMPKTDATSSLLSKFTQFGSSPTEDPAVVRKRDVIQSVYNDYKSVRDSGKLSREDKNRFESYISLIDEIQKGLAAAPSAGTCAGPNQEAEPNADAKYRNQINILVAAMACNLTRVASMVPTVSYEPMHSYAHSAGEAGKHAEIQKGLAAHMAYLMSRMDSIVEAGGASMLDNSIIYLGNEYGEFRDGDSHRTDNMFGVVAGGAAGKLQQGYYVNYQKGNRRPYNNFLITLFNAMGLSSADYEREGVIGFGEYNTGAINNYGYSQWVTTAERRKPLSFLYKGPVLG